jgi:hypothetical protein
MNRQSLAASEVSLAARGNSNYFQKTTLALEHRRAQRRYNAFLAGGWSFESPPIVVKSQTVAGSYYYHGLLVLLGHKYGPRFHHLERAYLKEVWLHSRPKRKPGVRSMNSSALRLLAGSPWRQFMMADSDCFVPTCWAGSQVGSMRSAISLEEAAPAAWR